MTLAPSLYLARVCSPGFARRKARGERIIRFGRRRPGGRAHPDRVMTTMRPPATLSLDNRKEAQEWQR
jgi:hypothetical protein